MPRSNLIFPAMRPASANAQTLALIASALVLATIVAFLTMVFTAWPVRAEETARPAPREMLQPASFGRPAALQTPSPTPGACDEALAASETEVNATLARYEQIEEQSLDQQCPALRAHIDALARAATVADRCTAATERASKVSFIRQTAAEWRGVVSTSCR
ncbi:hypothetical protein [Phreatobacter sp. AB_2022a]|uniref:hypothetical protein n=1 Tax=Phreatobacter sp. AB_2022a TaxID=3003134 RepID=UPI00228707BC|nr:hypothetical protein [Phreatobacter sp. AB_2022a]MCZ0737928.1 hypothetical protein [Phreatobacter sp. AB_2022a]